MNQVTFIADGEKQDFYFTFPFFIKSDVVVEVNSVPATKYEIICVSDGLNADFPFTGGRVHFAKPPKVADVITISRHLPSRRIVDYQSTAPYNPIALNQDFNYLMELVKDMQSRLDGFATKYSEITNRDSFNVMLQKMDRLLSATDDLSVHADQLKELLKSSEIDASIESLNMAVNTLNSQCDQLNTEVENIKASNPLQDLDFVIESQMPTAENDYTWYRKYQSGWVEQGGAYTGNPLGTVSVNLLIPFSDTNYSVTITQGLYAAEYADIRDRYIKSKTKNSFVTSSASSVRFTWFACGIME